MSNDRIIETSASSDLATFTIKIDGKAIPGTVQVTSIHVNKEVNRIPFAKLVILDGDPSEGDFPISNEDFFIPGKEIEILAGYHSEEDTIFKGLVTKQKVSTRKNGQPKVIVECRDKVFLMTIAKKSKYFYELTDADMFEEIVGEYDLEAEIGTTEISYPEIVQFDVTDWDFVMIRSEINGMLCLINDGKISIVSPDFDQDAVVNLQYGATILEFDAELEGRFQSGVVSRSWDFAKQKIIEVDGDASITEAGNLPGDDISGALGIEEQQLQFGGAADEEEIQLWADAKLLRNRMSKVRGRVKFQGLASVITGSSIELAGVGERYNGKVFVTGVSHAIINGQWTTDAQFGISPNWFQENLQTTNTSTFLYPGIQGLQFGVVVALEGDPDGEDRIKVKLPIISPDEDGIWARLASVDAGKSRGVFFRPELKDEVIVGFINNDPLNAIVLGSLHSSAKPVAEDITDDNFIKGIVTKGKLKFTFDDEKLIIKIETPSGKVIKMDDDEGSILLEDENGNKLLLNSDGITIESAADLNLTASGNIILEGTDITNTAGGAFAAEGSSGADFTSGGTVKIEGSVVNIN